MRNIQENTQNLRQSQRSLRVFSLSRTTKTSGHTILLAESAEEGPVVARHEHPDLIVCDILLPKMDGFDLIKGLKTDEKLRSIPVIAITILTERGDREQSLAAGFDDYIPKPIWSEKSVAQVEKSICPAPQ